MRRLCFITLAVLISAPFATAQSKRPITFRDLMQVKRISDPQVSPDGKWVAFVMAKVDFQANKLGDHIWIIPTSGGEPRALTSGASSGTTPRWSPDGKSIAFISSRGGKSQIWVIPVDGGEARRVTSISTAIDDFAWAAKSGTLVFVSKVFPDCQSDACNLEKLEAAARSKVKARLIQSLLFRHWDSWRDGRYNHVFSAPLSGGNPRDLTPGAFQSPTFFLGAPQQFAISPNGTEICITSNHTLPPSAPAWTTNNDLYLVSSSGGELKDITSNNPGSDASPQFSPNGRYIAYTSQATNGYESSLFRLRVYDTKTGEVKDLSNGFDQWVVGFRWAPDSDTIYFVAPDQGEQPIFKTSVSHPVVSKVLQGHFDDLFVTPDGKDLIFTSTSLTQPSEVYRASVSGARLTALTHENGPLLSGLDLHRAEFVETQGALGATIQNLLLKPPAFDRTKKYPAIFLIHGGPQGAWDDSWGYRWNAQMFASHGYVVMMPNPHGSTGYGQKFVAEISGDWGGACYQDLMKAADYLAALPYVDKNRMGAAGASFGGYMIDWIAGHTTRFKALVSHDGVYDLRSMYGETEELWFPEWELKGTAWENTGLYQKFSPSNFAQNIRTPMMLVEGGRDFRVPEGQAFQLFTALQRRGIASKLLYFPDESHFVQKPQNSRLWYQTVLAWMDHYLNP
ncbi:MAG: prolyl oligopeptidase family serine peptidase [Terriglobia bacterium]